MRTIYRKHHRITSCIAVLAIFCTILVSGIDASAISSDTPSIWAQDEVDTARAKGLIIMEADQNYKSNISRRLFCDLVVNLVETVLGQSVAVTVTNTFEDADEVDIIKAYQLGIIKGVSATRFAPDEFITREQIAAMMMRSARKLDELKGAIYADVPDATTVTFADQSDISYWALGDVQIAHRLGIIQGIGENRINPKGNTTVEQSILLINRLYDGFTSFVESSGSSTGDTGTSTGDTGTSTGDIGTSVNQPPEAISNPVAFTVPEQTPLTIAASQLALDPDGDGLSIVRINGQTSNYNTLYGTVSLTADGGCVYTSGDVSANVTDDFVVTVSDETNETHVNVRVNMTAALELNFKPSIASVSISGSAAVGETLRANLIRYTSVPPSPSPLLKYQWMRASSLNGAYSNIPGATGSSYVITQDDTGKYLKLQITASGSAGGSASSAANGPASLFSGGNGSISSPYCIANAQQFMLLDAIGINTSGKYYELESDIFLQLNQYVSSVFLGKLDGNGHTVSLDIEMSEELQGVGLFTKITSNAEISNLHVIGRISVPATDYVGGITGINSYGTISECISTVAINAHNYVGGIAGNNSGIIEKCGIVSDHVTGNAITGGLVGINYIDGVIQNCYARVKVFANGNEGGLVGWNEGTVAFCYSAGKVEGYNNIGGLIGHNDGGTVTASYYDKDISGRNDTGRGTPKTTVQMQTKATYASWNFTSVWSSNPGQYPELRLD